MRQCTITYRDISIDLHSRLAVALSHKNNGFICYSKVTCILSGIELHTIIIRAWRIRRAEAVEICLQLCYRLNRPLRTYMDNAVLLLYLPYVLESTIRIMPAQARTAVGRSVSVSVKQCAHT